MKYVIEIFENGVRSDVLVTNDEYDWDSYSKLFSDKEDSYFNKGYKIIGDTSSTKCSCEVLFNEDDMKSAVVSAKFHTESDFIDADGRHIILSELYRSEDSGDKYVIKKSPWSRKCKLYLRNIDKWKCHVKNVKGCTRLLTTVDDKYDFDQKFIDSLKLHREK